MPSSPWAATGSAGSATAATTPLGTQAGVDGAQNGVNQINSVDYLSNQDKIQLRRDWDAEQQIKTQLDAQASALGVSATAYDNAVAALSSNLISAGAPSGWATSWPDGTAFNVTSIVINLRTWWTSIALNRDTLRKAIGDKIQANAAYSDALARSSNNLIKNGNCEQTTPPPTGYEAAGVAVGGAYTGTRSVHIAPNAGWAFFDKANIPCVGGDQFRFEATAYNNTTNQCLLALEWFDSIGAVLSETSTAVYSTTGVWSALTLDGIAPGSAASVSFRVQAYSSSAGTSNTYFDNLFACRKVNVGMLQADAIQTSNYTESGGNPTAGAKMDTATRR